MTGKPFESFRQIGRFVGYFNSNQPRFSYIKAQCILISLITFCYPFGEFLKLINSHSIFASLETILHFSSGVHVILKHLIIIKKQTDVDNLINLIEEMYKISFKKHQNKMKKSENIITTIVNTCIIVLIILIISVFGMCLYEMDKMYLPVGNFQYFNTDKYFTLIFIFDGFVLSTAAICQLFTYTFLISVIIHISSQIDILKDNINSFQNMQQRNFDHFLIPTVQHHSNIIRAVKEANEILSGGLFIEMLMSSIQICLVAYSLKKAIVSQNSRYLMFSICFIVAIAAPLLISLCGNEISRQKQDLFKTICEYPWYEEPPKNRKKYLMVLRAACGPLSLNFREIVLFGLSQYASMLQAAYSYVTLLNTMETK